MDIDISGWDGYLWRIRGGEHEYIIFCKSMWNYIISPKYFCVVLVLLCFYVLGGFVTIYHTTALLLLRVVLMSAQVLLSES